MTAAALVPHYLVAKLLQDQTSDQLRRICKRAGVPYATVWYWYSKRKAARIDLFCKVANAAGYEVVLTRVIPPLEPEKPAMKRQISDAAMSKLRIFDRNKRIEVMSGNKLVGYVDEGMLFGIGADGYASEVAEINHRAEIIGKLEAWRAQKRAA